MCFSVCFSGASAQSRFKRFSGFASSTRKMSLISALIVYDEILQVFDDEFPKPKEQVEQEQDVDRINE